MANDQIDYHASDFGAGYELLEALKESGVLTEARYSIIMNMSLIVESTGNTPTSVTYKKRLISWNAFSDVYLDYDQNESIEDIWRGLGFPRSFFEEGGKNADDNMRKALNRMVDHFINTNSEAKKVLVKPGMRMKAYSKRYRGAHDMPDDELPPSVNDINPGKKGRNTNATRAIEKINSQELMSGMFYSDITRIPPSRWSSWLKFWDRDKSSVKQDKNLIFRSWKKTFVLGYQVEQNLVYEIWYNSLDSSFTVHDYRGNQLTRKFVTLSEATKALINAVVQTSSQDAEFFQAGLNNPIANSLLRTMAGGLDQHIEDMKRVEHKEQLAQQAAHDAAERAKAAADAEKLKRKEEAAATRAANWEMFKTLAASEVHDLAVDMYGNKDDLKADLKNAGSRIMRDAKTIAFKFGLPAADVLMDKLRSGAINMDQFMTSVAVSLDIAGTPEEKNIRDALKDGEISLADYLAGIRTLAQRRRKDTRRENRKEFVHTDSKQQSAKAPEPVRDPWSAPKNPVDINIAKRESDQETYFTRRKVDAGKKPASTTKTSASNPWNVPTKKDRSMNAYLTNKGATRTFESFIDNIENYEVQEELIDDVVSGGDHDVMIKSLRRDADKGQFTQNAMKQAVNSELISVYNSTRVQVNFPSSIVPHWINKGRKDPIVLPTDKPSILNRAKMFVRGMRYQADFIVGFSLSERVNVEIWYVTEPNPEYALSSYGAVDDFSKKPTITSFYIFDVTSGRLLRKFVPYYRNAVQIAMAKLSAQ